ncbi:MAG: DUF1295 domain-containing protein [Planctomycetota bacterium]
MNPWLLLLYGWIGSAIVMLVLWFVQRATKKASIVDVAWTIGVGCLGVFYAWAGDGDVQRRILVGVLSGLWSVRLATHLLFRVLRMPEDGRYLEVHRQWKDKAQVFLFWFFQLQATWAVLFAIPLLIASQNTEGLGISDAIGIAIWVIAIGGEAIADAQLTRFRRSPVNSGKVCRDGLWRYSRHPNYFFEWVHWWAYVALAITGSQGWIAIAGPAVMLFFLLKITGIPPTEKQALLSRGDAYRDYQRTTSAFFPWPPRESESN